MASSVTSPTFMRLLSASVAVSHKAARIVRDIFQKGELGIIEKAGKELQTEADRSAQRCIVASLHRQFPKVQIFGEEDDTGIFTRGGVKIPVSFCCHSWDSYGIHSKQQLDPSEKIDPESLELSANEEVLKCSCPENLKNVADEDIVVWVDPLDGTAEYTQGLLDHVTVLIGIAVKGEAVGGVIFQPYYNYKAGPDAELGRCIWGALGLGAFGFTKNMPPDGKHLITTTRSHSDRLVTEAVESCKPTEIVRVGGAGHKVLLLIEGKVHAYVFASKGCKKWDTCAPQAILHAIGGTLTDIHGNRIPYQACVPRRNASGVLAALKDHSWYVENIPEFVREMLPPDPIKDNEQFQKL